MKGIGLVFLSISALTISAASAAPQAPASRPAPSDTDHAGSIWQDLQPEQWFSHLRNFFAASNPQEWPQARDFIQEHSPRRWEAFQSLQPDSASRRSVQRFILTRYKALMRLKDKDPAMYKLQLHELELEDRIFGITLEMHGRFAYERLRDSLQKNAQELVDTRLNIRKLRIERLEKAVDAAKTRLQKDQKDRDALVEREMRSVTERAFPSHRRGRGEYHHPQPTTRQTAPESNEGTPSPGNPGEGGGGGIAPKRPHADPPSAYPEKK